MNQEETIKLFECCELARAKALDEAVAAGKSPKVAEDTAHGDAQDVWNGWAEPMLAERKKLEEAGEWKVEKDIHGGLLPKNEATKKWFQTAKADFTHCEFRLQPVGGQTQFPVGRVITLVGNSIRFDGFIFPGEAQFRWAQFYGRTDFDDTCFSGLACFKDVKFCGRTMFHRACFSGDAEFGGAKFCRRAMFKRAIFGGKAEFRWVQFKSDAFFTQATFEADTSHSMARFNYFADFAGARFDKDANFYAILSERGFSLARTTFAIVPNFIQAHFTEAPRLDHIILKGDPEQEALSQQRNNDQPSNADEDAEVNKANVASKYRALKLIAIQGSDHDREHEFFIAELRATWPRKNRGRFLRRARCLYGWLSGFVKWLFNGEWLIRFVIGLYGFFSNFRRSIGRWLVRSVIGLYGCSSDFGRSFLRPLGAWFGLVVLCFVTHWFSACSYSCSTPQWQSAFSLSWKNGLVAFSGSQDHRVTDAYRCLYGEQFNPPITPGPGIPGAVPTPTVNPAIPSWITIMENAQSLFSIILLFLAALGVRNQFRIK